MNFGSAWLDRRSHDAILWFQQLQNVFERDKLSTTKIKPLRASYDIMRIAHDKFSARSLQELDLSDCTVTLSSPFGVSLGIPSTQWCWLYGQRPTQ